MTSRNDEKRKLLISEEIDALTGIAYSDPFQLRKCQNASIEWYLSAGAANFDFILQYLGPDGTTWYDGSALGANNATFIGSEVLAAHTVARGVTDLSIPYFTGDMRLRINNKHANAATIVVWLHRD